MEGRSNATWVGLLVVGVVVLGAPATAAASYYGEGSYFGNEYYGLAGVTAPGGGGTCLNCEGDEGSSGLSYGIPYVGSNQQADFAVSILYLLTHSI